MSKHAEFLINDCNKNKSRLHKGILNEQCVSLGRLSPSRLNLRMMWVWVCHTITRNSIGLIEDILVSELSGNDIREIVCKLHELFKIFLGDYSYVSASF